MNLGVTFHQSLKLRLHIAATRIKANSIVGCIKRLINYMDRDTFCILFKSIT